MIKEIWKPIPGYENEYSISNLGRVRSEARAIKCSGKVKGTYLSNRKEKILKPGRGSNGYFTVSLRRHNSRTIHSLLMETFVGKKPKGKEVMHLNDVRDDNRLENLAYGTRSENNLSASKNDKRKISRKIVEKIKKAHNTGAVSQYSLAKKYKISTSQINNIVHGRQRKHA